MNYVIDLFCGSGGASVGLTHAGYKVIGVDLRSRSQTDYPAGYLNMFGQICDFIQDDPLAVLREFLCGKAIAGIKLSQVAFFWVNLPPFLGFERKKASLLDHLRFGLKETKKPYVIAHSNPDTFCVGSHFFKIEGPEIGQMPREQNGPCSFRGRSFKPGLIYTKLFEANCRIKTPVRIGTLRGIYDNERRSGKEGWDYLSIDNPEKNKGQLKKRSVLKQTLGVTWAKGKKDEQHRKIMNSCPPAYSRYIGREMTRFLEEPKKKRKPLDYLNLPKMGEL